jgi:ureidoglycolate dehydrogenase (NAD+)
MNYNLMLLFSIVKGEIKMSTLYMVKPQVLQEICSNILYKNGIPGDDAKLVAHSIIDADLQGTSSHGVSRMSVYINRIKKGGVIIKPDIKVIKETSNTAVIDGGGGLGQVVSQNAVDLVMEKINTSNISAVSVRNSNHFGMAAYWAAQITKDGLIGIAASNVDPSMVPTGAAAPGIGNNPFAIAVPTGITTPIILDMATSVVAFGKIINARNKGQSIPMGWALDSQGQPTTDPKEASMLFPVGGPKGYGLAVIVDIFTALLSGGVFASELGGLYKDLDKPNQTSHFFAAIRIDSFIEPDLFKKSVAEYIKYLKSLPLASGSDAIYLPGEIEALNKEKNLKSGILLPAVVVNELMSLAEEAKIDKAQIDQIKANPQD